MKRLIQFELKKIFSKRLTQAALAFLFLLSLLLIFSTFQNMRVTVGTERAAGGRLWKLTNPSPQDMRAY